MRVLFQSWFTVYFDRFLKVAFPIVKFWRSLGRSLGNSDRCRNSVMAYLKVQWNYTHKVAVVLHDNLQRESHKHYVRRSSTTWFSCYVSKRILSPSVPVIKHIDLRAHYFAHFVDLWHRLGLVSVSCACSWRLYVINPVLLLRYWGKRRKEARNRPGVSQRVPGGLGSQISWHRHAKVVTSASHTGLLYPQECSWYSFSLGAESNWGKRPQKNSN
jgi:hypothetical protein